MAGAGREVIFDNNYIPAALRPAADAPAPVLQQPTTSGRPNEVVREETPTEAKQLPSGPQTTETPTVNITESGKLEIHISSPDKVMKKVAALAIRVNGQILEQQKCESSAKKRQLLEQHKEDIERLNRHIWAAADGEFRTGEQQQVLDTIRSTPAAANPELLKTFSNALRDRMEELYNAIRNYLMLWYALRQLDSGNVSDERLTTWQKNFQFCRDHLNRLGEKWKKALFRFEAEHDDTYNMCIDMGTPKKKKSGGIFSPVKTTKK